MVALHVTSPNATCVQWGILRFTFAVLFSIVHAGTARPDEIARRSSPPPFRRLARFGNHVYTSQDSFQFRARGVNS